MHKAKIVSAPGFQFIGNQTPTDPDLYDSWLDTSQVQNVWKVYNGSSWDTIIDFTTAKILIQIPRRRGLRSLFTYTSETEPLDPEAGEIWYKPSTGAVLLNKEPFNWYRLK